MTWRTIVLVCVIGMTMAAVARAAAPPAQGPLWVPLPGGVANAAGTIGYVANPDGYTEALDLTNGRVLWESSIPCRPLAVVNGRLVGWAPSTGFSKRPGIPFSPSPFTSSPPAPNLFYLVVLDAANGQATWTSKAQTLPEWADVNLSYAHTFVITAEQCGRTLLLRWEAGAS
jgi:outer membrane protein assembly factor BamB